MYEELYIREKGEERTREEDEERKRVGKKERWKARGATNLYVEVADAIRRQRRQIAATRSRHNEPIRLYFYFRHAAYRAIPSLRGGYRDVARLARRYTRAYAHARTRARYLRIHDASSSWRDARTRRPSHARAISRTPSYIARGGPADAC